MSFESRFRGPVRLVVRTGLRFAVVTGIMLGAIAAGAPVTAAPGAAASRLLNVTNLDTDVRNEVLRWGTDGSTTKVVFRYRVDELSSATGSVCATTPCGIAKTGGPTFGEVTRPAPFRNFRYLRLDGLDDAVLGTSNLATETRLGFTVMVWFRSTNSGQVAKLFSNTEGFRGFALTYDAGLLRGTYSFKPDGQVDPPSAANRRTVYQPVASPYRLDDGKWHLAAFTVTRMPITGGSGYQARARLYVDGVQVTSPSDYLEFPGNDFSFWDSASVPAVGAEPDSDAAASGFFQGEINAAVVYNYQVDHNVLALHPPYDGDLMYLGMPSYFDYLRDQETPPDGSGGTWNYAHRFTASERDSRWSTHVTAEQARVAMPLISANYVPQGIAISEDGQTLYNFFYYAAEDGKNLSGGLCGTPCPPYALTTTDLNTQKVTAIYHLTGMPGNHAGGVVATHNRVYVGDLGGGASKTIHRFNLAGLTPKPGGAGDLTHDVPPIYEVGPDASYNWDPSNNYPDATNSALAYSPATQAIYAMGYYGFDDNGVPDDPAANRIFELPVDALGAVSTTPSRSFQLPTSSMATYGYNQGMTPIPGTTDCFLISHQVKANDSSQLVKWCSGGGWTVKQTLPGVTENLAIGPDNLVWVSNENPARRWQKSPTGQWWDRFTPYIAGIPLARLN